MNFANFDTHTNQLFTNDRLLKFVDIIQIEQIKLAFQFVNKELPYDVLSLFKLNTEVNKVRTRTAATNGLYIPKIRTTTFGIKSLRYSVARMWNEFIKNNHQFVTIKTVSNLKYLLKKHFISLYSKL